MLHLHDTVAASRLLEERHGVKLAPSYLRKLRCLGTGPAFVLFNNKPFYTDETLAEYVAAQTSAPAKSGVEHAAAGNRRQRKASVQLEDHDDGVEARHPR